LKSARKSVAYRCATVILSAVLVVASLSLTGCSFQSLIPSGDGNTTTTTKAPGATLAPTGGTAGNLSAEQTNKPLAPSYCNPLTGLTSSFDMSEVRPVAVCIGNSPTSALYGIGHAEILIEAPVEDGSTRLLALTNTYQNRAEIGSVRSSRRYLLSFASAFGAVSVFDGTSDIGTKTDCSAYDCLDFSDERLSTVFYRSSSLFAPHNLFTSGTRLLGAMENFEKCGPTSVFRFTDKDTVLVPSDGAAGGVAIPYSTTQVVQFVYHGESETYLRMQNGKPHKDGDGKQLGFTNLLLLVCESSTYNKVNGTELDLNVEGGGSGYYLSAGGYTEILWSRSADGNLVLADASGTPICMNRGNTYIGLIDLRSSSSVLIVE